MRVQEAHALPCVGFELLVQNFIQVHQFVGEHGPGGQGRYIESRIRPRFTDPPVHTYVFELHPRDLDDKQFEWAFQRQLFDCLHDYLVEMFIRTPQQRKERQQIEQEGKL